MQPYRKGAHDSVTELEAKLVKFVEDAKRLKSQKAVAKLLSEILADIKEVMPKLSVGDASLTPVRKSIVPILNTVSSLHSGVESGDLARSEFTHAVGNLHKRFLPLFRQQLDKLTKKLDTEDTIDRSEGVHIVTGATGVYNSLYRLARSIQSDRFRQTDPAQAVATLKSNLSGIQTLLNTIPPSKDLDNLVDSLKACWSATNTILATVQRGAKVRDLDKVNTALVGLQRDTKEVNRLVVNNILTVGEGKRTDNLPDKAKAVKEAAPLRRDKDQFVKDQISEVKAGKAQLPKRIPGPFSIKFRAPTVAIFDSHDNIAKKDRPMGPGTVSHNFSKHSLLDQFGIKYITLDDYLIVENQMMLMIDKPYFKKYVTENTTGRSKPKTGDKELVAYARSILEMLNERSSQSLVMVSQQFIANPRNTDYVMFWVMPSRVLDALIKRGWNKLSSWNLPFDA